MYVELIVQMILGDICINMQVIMKVEDIMLSMVPAWLQQPYIMMQSTEHAGYRTVKPMMKKLLMGMLVPVEQKNKKCTEIRNKKERITKVVLFFYTKNGRR